jgi:hypothetical protein
VKQKTPLLGGVFFASRYLIHNFHYGIAGTSPGAPAAAGTAVLIDTVRHAIVYNGAVSALQPASGAGHAKLGADFKTEFKFFWFRHNLSPPQYF